MVLLGTVFLTPHAKILEKLFLINKNKVTVGVCWVYVENHLKKSQKYSRHLETRAQSRIPAPSGVSRVFRQFRLASNGSVLQYTSFQPQLTRCHARQGEPPLEPLPFLHPHTDLLFRFTQSKPHLFLFEYSPIAISDGI